MFERKKFLGVRSTLREVVKTILHARDPLLGGGGLGKRPWVCTGRWGGWVRDHGSVQTGGGMGKRPWVCTDRWGGWVRDHGSVQTGGGDGQETMGLYRQVGWMDRRP